VAAVTFDTLKFVETLEQAQMPQEQARAIATAIRETYSAADVAAKGDIRDVRQELEIIRKEMEIMRRDIIIKLGAMVIGMGVILIATMGAMTAFLSG